MKSFYTSAILLTMVFVLAALWDATQVNAGVAYVANNDCQMLSNCNAQCMTYANAGTSICDSVTCNASGGISAKVCYESSSGSQYCNGIYSFKCTCSWVRGVPGVNDIVMGGCAAPGCANASFYSFTTFKVSTCP